MNLIQKIRRKILIRRVNKALHIKLTDWQIAHIFDGEPFPEEIQYARRVGKTTAQILFVLLSKNRIPGNNLLMIVDEIDHLHYPCVFPSQLAARNAFIFNEDGVTARRRYFFMRELLKVKDQLKARHIKTNTVCFLYHGRRHHYI